MRSLFQISPTLTPDRVAKMTLPQVLMLFDDSDGMIKCGSIEEAREMLTEINRSRGRN